MQDIPLESKQATVHAAYEVIRCAVNTQSVRRSLRSLTSEFEHNVTQVDQH
jgi:P2-related tail formation protein